MKKVRCIVDTEPDLTKGKVYEVVDEDHGMIGVEDDEGDGAYLYSPTCFEVVEE